MDIWQGFAESYLEEMWCTQDRQLVREFSAREVTCEMLHDLCCRYGVARTIPGHIEEIGLEGKYKPFVDMLNKHRETVMTRESVPEIIDKEVANMREKYKGRSLWSAISKAFWMMKQHPVVIYDNFAWKGLQKLGLKPGYKTYREYFDAWFTLFERRETKEALDDACSWLIKSPIALSLLAAGKLTASEFESIAGSKWFRNRVTDMWLCQKGGARWFKGDGC
jgi:hypothetical protein